MYNVAGYSHQQIRLFNSNVNDLIKCVLNLIPISLKYSCLCELPMQMFLILSIHEFWNKENQIAKMLEPTYKKKDRSRFKTKGKKRCTICPYEKPCLNKMINRYRQHFYRNNHTKCNFRIATIFRKKEKYLSTWIVSKKKTSGWTNLLQLMLTWSPNPETGASRPATNIYPGSTWRRKQFPTNLPTFIYTHHSKDSEIKRTQGPLKSWRHGHQPEGTCPNHVRS